MVTLDYLKIKGFRAYMEVKEFNFDNPIILLFGENHQGKSSTLNAIEWCLFGNDCIGAKSGIRERIDWEIPNRHLGSSPDVSIELKLEDENKHCYTIMRRWISKTKDELKVTLQDGQLLEGQNAKEKVTHLLNSSFRDFLTTVYQHQEAIRAILTQEPKERNDAIDRLLGLSDYRNILSGIEAAKLKGKQKEMGNSFDSFEKKIEGSLGARESDLKDKREKAIEKGINQDQLSEKGALEIASGIKGQLINFSREVGLAITDIKVPNQWKELSPFQKVTDGDIKRFRSEMPNVKEQNTLFKSRARFTQLKTEYEGKKKESRSYEEEFERFIEENGKENSMIQTKSKLEKNISEKEKEMSETDAKATAVSKAMNFLRLEGIKQDIFPV